MERTDCENYVHNRTKNKNKLPVSRTTVLNEQSTINAMMLRVHQRGERYIEAFEFKKLGNYAKQNSSFDSHFFDQITLLLFFI
jgi:hypothetical protein